MRWPLGLHMKTGLQVFDQSLQRASRARALQRLSQMLYSDQLYIYLAAKMWAAMLCAVLALSATANAVRDIGSARDLLQTAGIESVANAVAQQPAFPQMVSSGP